MSDFSKKYGDIIKEECNVKEVIFSDDSNNFKIVIKPIGFALKEKYGSDTGKIIGLAKNGNAKILSDGTAQVFDENNTWTLEPSEYEVAYEGIDENFMSAQGGVVVELDMNLTPQLLEEGVAREISRSINQLRKDADFDVSDRVDSFFQADEHSKQIIEKFSDYLCSEGLLKSINFFQPQDFDIEGEYKEEGKNISIFLKK